MIQNITPAERVSAVQEYYFSRKLKEVARTRHHLIGHRITRYASISTNGKKTVRGSSTTQCPRLSAHHGNTRTATGHGPFLQTMVQC